MVIGMFRVNELDIVNKKYKHPRMFLVLRWWSLVLFEPSFYTPDSTQIPFLDVQGWQILNPNYMSLSKFGPL